MASGRILVVDDTEANRILLQEMLELDGHEVTLAADGAEALRAATEDDPDLVLLDVNMPGMDGLEVCRRLRNDPRGSAIPIILVTALAERQHRLQGIGAGANDYLTKPIDRPDLLLRVRNALRFRRLHRELAEQFARLQQLEKLRDTLVHMLVHDLRTPLTGITAYLQMSHDRIAEIGDAELLCDFEDLSISVVRLTDMVSDVLDVSRIEADAMPLRTREVDLCEVASEAVRSLGRYGNGSVTCRYPEGGLSAVVDPEVVRRVMANLVGNALKFAPRNSEVVVEITRGGEGPEVRVIDSGPGIPAQYHAGIFEKFAGAEGNGERGSRSSGLGLTFCKLAVEAHGGRIGVDSVVGQGSTFWFVLPGR